MIEDAPIVVVAAVTAELAPLVRRLRLERLEDGPGIRYAGSLRGRSVVAAVTGIGRRRAATRMAELLETHRPGRVYVIGFAGGTNPRLRPGSLLIPAEVIDAATGQRHRPTLPCDAAEGVLWTADRMVSGLDEKADLFERRGVDAVDMETAELAAVCEQRGVAWLAIRAISDAAEQTLPAFVARLNRADGRADVWAAARCVLTDPRRVGALLRLARQSGAAARALSERFVTLA